jgi:hypothetical protein
MWSIHKTEYYWAIKKSEIMSFARKLMELDIIMLSKINQTENNKYHMFTLICEI